MNVKYIDPPSGWLYGFPKELPEDVEDINKWLVENDYPQEEVDYWINSEMGFVPCNMFIGEREEN